MKISAVIPARLLYRLIRAQMKVDLVRKSIIDDNRKPLSRIIPEIVQCAIKNKGFPSYYFHSFLYRQDVDNCHDYITDKEINLILPLMVNEEMSPFLHNKLLFHQYFSECDIILPKLIGYNVGSFFVLREEKSEPENLNPYKVIRKLPSLSSTHSVFMKPVCGGKGKFCYKITERTSQEEVKEIISRLEKGNYIFEEGLLQHPALNEIYPHSINSLRINTCILKDGSINLLAAKYRFGKGGMVVDNSSSGGISVNVNLENGEFGHYARMAYYDGGDLITKHPDTGFRFSGFIVPQFQAIKEMVLKAARHLPYKLVGWDMALTENGPVLIEGNNRPHISGTELTYGGFKKNKIFTTFLEELKTA